MALTREFKNTVAARAQRDPRFREALFTEALNAYFAGDTAVGKAILRDLVNATVGFEELAADAQEAEQELASDAGSARQPEHGELFQYRERPPEESPRETARDCESQLSVTGHDSFRGAWRTRSFLASPPLTASSNTSCP